MKKPMAKLENIAAWSDRELRHAEIFDWDGAKNGLQLENKGTVTKIGAAVDAHEPAIDAAIAAGVDLLVVHHGLFWTGLAPLTGATHRKIRKAMDANLAVYSSHLPLDAHPKLGNNALLASALGWKRAQPFFMEKGTLIGRRAQVSTTRIELRSILEKVLGGKVTLLAGGPGRIRNVGLVTGGAGGEVAKASAEGIDTFITGEGQHWTFGLAHELGVNVFYGGHYATETFGVKALARALSGKFKVPWVFLDVPSGL